MLVQAVLGAGVRAAKTTTATALLTWIREIIVTTAQQVETTLVDLLLAAHIEEEKGET